MSKYSFRSNENVAEILKAMFWVSNNAKNFSCSRTKMAYLVTYGIAPDFHQALIDCLHEKDFYFILFDESFNKTLQEEQMDVLVRYWHVDHVITCYFGSAFLGHTIAEDLLEAINDVVCPLDRSKIVQMGMDGPNTNIKRCVFW